MLVTGPDQVIDARLGGNLPCLHLLFGSGSSICQAHAAAPSCLLPVSPAGVARFPHLCSRMQMEASLYNTSTEAVHARKGPRQRKKLYLPAAGMHILLAWWANERVRRPPTYTRAPQSRPAQSANLDARQWLFGSPRAPRWD